MRIDQLEEIWRIIEDSSRPQELGWVRRLVNPRSAVLVHAAVACEGDARSIMFDLPVASIALLRDLPRTEALSVRLVPPLQGVPGGLRTLAVTLEDPQFGDLFCVFCADLVDGISDCVNVQDAVVLLLTRLERWQRFLSNAAEGLSQKAQIGLFGELWMLHDILVPALGIGMIAAWCGALRAPQDFLVPGVCAIEVKTTAGRSLSHVWIHGERQLDDSELGGLFLAGLRLRHDPGIGRALNDLVDDLRTLAGAAPEFSQLFAQRIADAGWFERHRAKYEASRFVVVEKRYFLVGQGFPRIRSCSIETGIDEVEYRLDLRACLPFERSDSQFLSILTGLSLPSRGAT